MFHSLRYLVSVLLLASLLTGCTGPKSLEKSEVTNNNTQIIAEGSTASQPKEESPPKEQESLNQEQKSPGKPPQQQTSSTPIDKKAEVSKEVSSVVAQQPTAPPTKVEASNNQASIAKEPVAEAIKESKVEGSYKNGTYRGSAEGNEGMVEVQVTVVNNRLDQITVLAHEDTENLAQNAFKLLSKKMIEQQNTDVDVISGATYSSKGFIHAVKNALK